MDGPGLADALVKAVGIVLLPGKALVSILCYVIGLGAAFVGLLRLMRSSEQGARGQSGTGTVATFLLSAVFLAFPEVVSAFGVTLFGAGGRGEGAGASLAYAGGNAPQYDLLLWAVFKVVEFVGLFWFLKGWFVLRDSADERNGATAGKAVAHILGGVCAWHILWVIDRVQSTLGIAPLRISEGAWT